MAISAEVQTELDKLNDHIQNVENRIRYDLDKVVAVTDRHTLDIVEINKQITDLNNKVSALDKKLNNLQTNFNTLRSYVKDCTLMRTIVNYENMNSRQQEFFNEVI